MPALLLAQGHVAGSRIRPPSDSNCNANNGLHIYRWGGKKVLASKLFGHYTKNVGISAAAAGRGGGEEVSVSVARTVFLKTNDEPDQMSPPKQMIRCSKWRLPVPVCDGRSCGRNN